MVSQGADAEYVLDLDAVASAKDLRTTIMIRNIPNKYTQNMLLNEINARHEGTYDFYYLPIDFKNRCNVGYAFINFMDPRSIIPFFTDFNAQCLQVTQQTVGQTYSFTITASTDPACAAPNAHGCTQDLTKIEINSCESRPGHDGSA